MLFLSDYRFTAASATYSHCSLWIFTDLVPFLTPAHPNELICTPSASMVSLRLDHSSSGQEYARQHKEVVAPCGQAEPFQLLESVLECAMAGLGMTKMDDSGWI